MSVSKLGINIISLFTSGCSTKKQNFSKEFFKNMEFYIKLFIFTSILNGLINCQERKKPIDQLPEWKKNNSHLNLSVVNQHGILMPSLTASLSVGSRGPLLLQDTHLVDHLAHFNRERIPERVVHAKGGGAFGYFEVTDDITNWTKASIFSAIGQKTPIAMRFSTVGGESGSADTLRDPRGFAVKFYAEDGNYDLVGNNIPIFFVRDPILFPSFIHTQKRNPKTHLKDANMFWDFMSLRPETTHQASFLFSDRGIPDGFRHMHGYGSHTFKMVNAADEAVYVKFHMRTEQGIRNLMANDASRLASLNPDYSIDDLYSAIDNGQYPSWKLFIQVMTFEEAETYHYHPFDLTKVWLHSEFPLIPVGRLILNRNPENYFAEIEQLAFTPSNMIPGIEASPDKMLQGRLFGYADTHRHRLGINYGQIPVNRPIMDEKKLAGQYNRDGLMNFNTVSKGAPNYFPNSFCGPTINPNAKGSIFSTKGDVIREDTGNEDNFSQTNLFWTKVLTKVERERLVTNMANHMKNAIGEVRERAIRNFEIANVEYGRMLRAAVQNALRK